MQFGLKLRDYAEGLFGAYIILGLIVGIGLIIKLEMGIWGFLIGIIVAAIIIGNGFFMYLIIGGFGTLILETSVINSNVAQILESGNDDNNAKEKIPTWKRLEMERQNK